MLMTKRYLCLFSRNMRRLKAFGGLLVSALLAVLSVASAGPLVAAERTVTPPFSPGEQLTYSISWSDILSAGTAVMAVKQEASKDGKALLRFISTARSTGMVDKFYRVDDNVQSLFDPATMLPLSYQMHQRHGRRKRERTLEFDHDHRNVIYQNNGHEETAEIPDDAQDALSSLYFLRTRETFTKGEPVVLNVHDSGKTWAVEIFVLGRERIKVPAGEFDTVKLKTYPKYEGVFMHKGEICIWLTDDSRRIPVLMQSTITIGSIMASLTDIQLRSGAR